MSYRSVAVAAVAAIFSFNPLTAMSADKPPLIIARNLDINTLDPSRGNGDTANIFMYAVYEPLIRLADDGSLLPLLAKSWDVSQNNTKFTFHLDPKAVFADGTAVDAKDVKWTWDRLINLQGAFAWLLNGVASIETPDAKTVVVTLKAPDGEFLSKIVAPPTGIVNSTASAKHGAKASQAEATADTAEAWFLTESAGSGPYMLKSYSPNNELRFKRNPAYWGKAAAIDEIVIKQVKDSVAQAQALQSGTVEIAMQIAPDTAKTIRSPNVVITTAPSYNFLYMALSPGAKSATVPLTKNVRQAIAMAIDYEGMIDITVGGAGRMLSVAIPNGFPGTDGLPKPVYDLQKAKAMLAAEGLAKGFELEAAFPNENFFGVDVATMMQKVQQDLAKANIRVKLNPVTFAVWLDTVNGNGTPLTAGYYGPDYFGTDNYVNTFAMIPGTRWFKRSGAARVEGVTNSAEKALLAEAGAAAAGDRDAVYRKLAMEMIADKIIIPLVSPDLVIAHAKNVEGLKYGISPIMALQNLSIRD
ncbi:peptide/nickel transport system substrate-binding protein [Neorhizobium galegae]|uniref:ABC transporter substrate-binding protein n=1 Tax=Neorhizobium galegae TaxID=399 RepID=UPI002785C631|nr:ABC transporter substrate-binding protein [Neorhizobium galegae]MDQ0138075.1 peptide/nickel transport system substrate-binding protein [Neorhizobium galegae]